MVYKTRKQGTVGFYNKQSYTFANKEVYSKTVANMHGEEGVHVRGGRNQQPDNYMVFRSHIIV